MSREGDRSGETAPPGLLDGPHFHDKVKRVGRNEQEFLREGEADEAGNPFFDGGGVRFGGGNALFSGSGFFLGRGFSPFLRDPDHASR